MGKKIRGVRDGTGSYEYSYQHKKSKRGKRQEEGEECQFIKNQKDISIW